MEFDLVKHERKHRDRNRKRIMRSEVYQGKDKAQKEEMMETIKGLFILLDGIEPEPLTKENKPLNSFLFSAFYHIEQEYISNFPKYCGRTLAERYYQEIYRAIAKFLTDHGIYKVKGDN